LRKVTEKLASMNLTVWNLVIMILWLGWGMVLAGSDTFTKGFQSMNAVLIKDWVFSSKTGFPILKIWFIGLCVLMIILCINLIFCTWDKIFKIIRQKFNGPKFFMLIVHTVFGFVALGHLGGLMLGYKHNNIQLGEGQRYGFEDGYEIELTKVLYTNDHKTLKKSYRSITKDDFDYTKNFADITLRKDGRDISKDSIYILNPMRHKDIQVTLRGFIEPPELNGVKNDAGTTPWVTVTVSKNPVLKTYLILYPIMIIGIFFYLLTTWKLAFKNNVQ
jgi:hypothetical protein